MADKTISALTASATPLDGTEVLPIVKGGATVKVAVSNLTAGRAVAFSGFTSTAGNLMADSTLLTWGNQGQGVQGIDAGGILRFYGSYAEQARISSAGVYVSNGDIQIGTAGKGVNFSANGGVIWRCGAGTPEGAVTAPVGSLYTRTDGGANTTLYVKESGVGNTGWVAK